MQIDPKDLKIDLYRPTGQGGFSMNKNETVVKLTHVPSGIEITEKDDRSVHRNKAEAFRKMEVAMALWPEAFGPKPPEPTGLMHHGELKAAWDKYRGDCELTLDDAFLFAAGWMAGRGLTK